MGDGIMIFFGDPESKGVKDDALASVRMAIDMRERMHALAEIWREAGIERPLQVRMGIHTGYCTVGNFGSDDRMDYTIIGGGANTASRLESAAQPGEILISYETFANIKDEILCEEEGQIDVKGIAYPVATYRVVDRFRHPRGQAAAFPGGASQYQGRSQSGLYGPRRSYARNGDPSGSSGPALGPRTALRTPAPGGTGASGATIHEAEPWHRPRPGGHAIGPGARTSRSGR